MKKIFIIAIVAISFAACKSKDTASTTNKDLLLLTDSSNLNQGSYLTDTGIAVNTPGQEAASNSSNSSQGNKTTVIYKTVPARSSNSTSTTSQSYPSNSTTTTRAPARTGISKGAKGAIIGGVGGAVGGAIIGKNVKGAAIGAAVGAAGGYIIGHSQDKKDGRIQ